MGSAYGVYAWLMIAAAFFGAFVWFNLGFAFYDSIDPAFSAFLLLASIASVGMAGVWRKG